MYQQPPHKQHGPSSSMQTERISDLLDQLKNECAIMENEFTITKTQKDDYERKLEAQMAEFQNMKQTIVELEVNFQTIKQQYEDKILHLQTQMKQLQQQSSQSHSSSNASAPSPIPSTPFLEKTMNPPPLPTRGPPPTDRRTPPPGMPGMTSISGGRRSPPSMMNSQQPPAKKQRVSGLLNDNSRPEDFAFPPSGSQTTTGNSAFSKAPVTNHQLTNAVGSSHPSSGPHFPPMVSNYGNEGRSLTNPPGPVPGIPSFNEIDTNGSPTAGGGMIHDIGKTNSGPDVGKPKESMLKKEGNDWVVVYNPQVKTNVNINLFHNIDHHSVVCCVRFSNDGKYLATGSNKLAQIFNVETGQRVKTFPADDTSKGTSKSPSPPPKPPMSPNSESVDPTTMGGDKEDSYVRSVCFSPDGKYLVAGAEDKTVKVWDIKSGAQRNSFSGHELDIYSLDFSNDSRFIVSGSGDGKARIWNMETSKCDHILGNEEIGPKEGVTSVAISPDGRVVAAGSLDCVVRLWDTQNGKFIENFKGHEDSVYSVAFSPDGKILASGSLDKTLKLWDLRAPYKCVATLSGHRDYVLSVAFSPDGKWLISGSKDRSVQFWDPRSNVLHLMLQGHKNSVISVALNPANNVFATGSGDYRARVWEWTTAL